MSTSRPPRWFPHHHRLLLAGRLRAAAAVEEGEQDDRDRSYDGDDASASSTSSSPRDALKTVAPTVEGVDDYLRLKLGLERIEIGTSIQGRPLWLYRWKKKNVSTTGAAESSGNDILRNIVRRRRQRQRPLPNSSASVFFLSLVHGNEPHGLLSHLWTIHYLLSSSFLELVPDDFELLFFPIVNVDAYVLNLQHGEGCRRTNLRRTCDDDEEVSPPVHKCPKPSEGGVDLNRNHPESWDLDDDEYGSSCGFTYKGDEPWSEPESRAIRDIVLKYGPTAALSFHTRGLVSSKPLLIHPFTSSRPLEENNHLDTYRDWSKYMNNNMPDNHRYVTGSAMEAIGYTASGSTIDWMHSEGNVMSFVLESATPCNGRWCLDYADKVWQMTSKDGLVGVKLVELVLKQQRKQQPKTEGLTNQVQRVLWSTTEIAVAGMICLLLLLLLAITKKKGFSGLRRCCWHYRRCILQSQITVKPKMSPTQRY